MLLFFLCHFSIFEFGRQGGGGANAMTMSFHFCFVPAM